MPNATAATCAYWPSCPPATVARPAARPCWSDRLMTNRTFGPGTMIKAQDRRANSAMRAEGSMPGSLARAYPAPHPSFGPAARAWRRGLAGHHVEEPQHGADLAVL